VSQSLTPLIDAFSQLNVLVVGDAMLDSYLEGESSRLSAEAPVPVVAIASRRDLPGGAANTAANVAGLGANATLLAAVGDDSEGSQLRSALAERGVPPENLVTARGRTTLAKHRVLASSQMVVRFDQGGVGSMTAEAERALLEKLDDLFAEADAVVVSDYGYGVLSPEVVRALAELQAKSPRVLLIDSKNLTRYRDVRPTVVKPNYKQALQILDVSETAIPRTDLIISKGDRVLELTGANIAAVTLDSEGALVFEHGRSPYRTYARPSPDWQSMGAGDTFASAFAMGLAAGAETPHAAELATAAAGIVVAKRGTALCSAEELQDEVSGRMKYLHGWDRLASVLTRHREEGRLIVFTNGCFDILHRGHITYLSRAKTLGDVLVVGLNSDSSVARLKGPGRPINTLEDRAQVLAALSCVDHIVAFDEQTPAALIEQVQPDVFVKGGDYTREMLPEAPLVEALGGRVEFVPYIEDRSTSGILERIREATSEPV
jgi:D-beta-D-heptose 7-phosphate kinase/D-beta-D-heptose 1-phosphate adenosyltransferase